ncbi:unnamed protein product [Mytilus coruscus]|uniref:Uncharacterized protein n=1 Tax=Mytilus coruscus TaxID=42192 RepID=A0A6J8E6T3_MYTCO|nr:unnamed protein product [Mytilus coruscus]
MSFNKTFKLKGKRFGKGEQLPIEIERKRKELYPVMKKAKSEGKKVELVRDKLYINGKPHISFDTKPYIRMFYYQQDAKEFWRLLNTNKSTTQPEIDFDKLVSYFKELDSNQRDDTEEHQNEINNVYEEINDALNSRITKHEILKALKNLKNKQSMRRIT